MLWFPHLCTFFLKPYVNDISFRPFYIYSSKPCNTHRVSQCLTASHITGVSAIFTAAFCLLFFTTKVPAFATEKTVLYFQASQASKLLAGIYPDLGQNGKWNLFSLKTTALGGWQLLIAAACLFPNVPRLWAGSLKWWGDKQVWMVKEATCTSPSL